MAASFDEDKPVLADTQGEPNAPGTGEGAGQPLRQQAQGARLSHGTAFGKEGPRYLRQGGAEKRPRSGESGQGSSAQSALPEIPP